MESLGLGIRRCFLALEMWVSYITSRPSIPSSTVDMISTDLM